MQGDRRAMKTESRTAEVQQPVMKWAVLLTTGSTLNYSEVTLDVSQKLTYCIKYNYLKP